MKKIIKLLLIITVIFSILFTSVFALAEPIQKRDLTSASKLSLFQQNIRIKFLTIYTKLTPTKQGIINKYTSKYQGDGLHNVGSGDSVKLDNNIEIRIKKIEQVTPLAFGEKNSLEVYADFYLNNKKINVQLVKFKLNTIPPNQAWQNYEFQEYGASISLPNKNKDIPLKVLFYNPSSKKYQLSFTSPQSLGKIISTKQLYDYCIENLPEDQISSCLRYSAYEPLENELILKNNKLQVIGENQDKVVWTYKQANACYNYIKSNYGIKPLSQPIPIRLQKELPLSGVSVEQVGVLIKESMISTNSDPAICSNPILLEEMAHFFLTPAPLSPIYNEGLANLLVYDSMEITEIEKLQSDFEVTLDPKNLQNSVFKLKHYSPITFFTGDHKIHFEFGQEINENWMSLSKISLMDGNAGKQLTDNILPIIHLKDALEVETTNIVTVDLYENKNPNNGLRCKHNGYQKYMGWKNTNGEILYIDESIAPSQSYMPLDLYLAPQYPHELYSDQFYRTATCFWNEVRESIDIKTILQEMRSYQNPKNEEFYLFKLLEEKGMDLEKLSKRYSIANPEQKYEISYKTILQGNIGKY